jgi:hypothetical protein
LPDIGQKNSRGKIKETVAFNRDNFQELYLSFKNTIFTSITVLLWDRLCKTPQVAISKLKFDKGFSK